MIRSLFNAADNHLQESLNHRLSQQNVIVSNIVNSQTPGYRAMGYDFEKQLQASMDNGETLAMGTSSDQHVKQLGVSGNGKIQADLFVKPNESIGNDGNTVDVDREMGDMASNQILYKATVEILNRRIALLKYAINGGRS